jgi:hypothetical protein
VRNASLNLDQWRRLLTVAVAGEAPPKPAPMLGRYAIRDDAIAFTPRFPLRAGLTYRVVFDPAALSNISFPSAGRIEATLVVPKPPAGAAPAVTAVHPSGDALPANLLKFYIHFSAPMTRGDSYRRIHIVDESGHDIPDAFLTLPEELWNANGTRLTLLFEPGRIKRGLKPNEDLGAPLVESRRYALVIDADWPDAQRTPLGKEFRRSFRVTQPDHAQPNPRHWKISPPKPGTLDPVAITFDEPLDHALVQRMLEVRDPAGRRLAGRVTTSRQETLWQFHPAALWQSGKYELIVDPALEDRAGNSVGRPFETRGHTAAASDAAIVLRFQVRP